MRNIGVVRIALSLIALILTAGCATGKKKGSLPQNYQKRGIASMMCTADINIYGNPSACGCEEKDTMYSHVLGQCFKPVVGKSKGCTKDINKYGNPSSCFCEDQFDYNAVKGQCLKAITLKPSGICTKDINPWGHASACGCSAGYSYFQKTGECIVELSAVKSRDLGADEVVNKARAAARALGIDKELIDIRMGKDYDQCLGRFLGKPILENVPYIMKTATLIYPDHKTASAAGEKIFDSEYNTIYEDPATHFSVQLCVAVGVAEK